MFELRLENDSENIVNINDGTNYVVTTCSGLNPPSASIFTAKSPNRKGLKYNGSTLNERNIVITIKILGDIEANRNALYAWTDTEQYVKVYYSNGIKDVYCEGHIVDCEIDLYTDNEIVNLAIICENPYWKDLQEISADISNIMKQFTFPFAIESTGIPFSTLRESNSAIVVNTGAETGAQFIIKCSSEVRNIIIYDANDTSRRFKINATLPVNSTVTIDTENSPKTVRMTKADGTISNMMKYVDANPTWFLLKKGNNAFGFSADAGEQNIVLSVKYSTKYLGV